MESQETRTEGATLLSEVNTSRRVLARLFSEVLGVGLDHPSTSHCEVYVKMGRVVAPGLLSRVVKGEAAQDYVIWVPENSELDVKEVRFDTTQLRDIDWRRRDIAPHQRSLVKNFVSLVNGIRLDRLTTE